MSSVKVYVRGANMIWRSKKVFYRIHQKALNTVLSMIKYPEPKLLKGAGSIKDLPSEIKKKEIDNVLIVTDQVLVKLGLLDNLFDGLKSEDINYSVFDGVHPNPTIQNVEDALIVYKENNCTAVIGFGGGSPMDCAKIVAARTTNDKAVSKMKGNFKLSKKLIISELSKYNLISFGMHVSIFFFNELSF